MDINVGDVVVINDRVHHIMRAEMAEVGEGREALRLRTIPMADDVTALRVLQWLDRVQEMLMGNVQPSAAHDADEWANRHGATVVLPDDESEGDE